MPLATIDSYVGGAYSTCCLAMGARPTFLAVDDSMSTVDYPTVIYYNFSQVFLGIYELSDDEDLLDSAPVLTRSHYENRRSRCDRQHRSRTVSALERAGREAIRISRSLGVDLITGAGLAEALNGVDAVVDAISSPPISPAETVTYFGTTTRNLLAAEENAGVRQHVLLSIVGIHRLEGNAHYAGKREQERLIGEGRVP